MNRILTVAMILSLTASGAISADTRPGALPPKLAKKVEAAIQDGLNWLVTQQAEDGSWSNKAFPALTAMPMETFLAVDHPKKKDVVGRAVKHILSRVQKDGGIYRKSIIPGRGGLSCYNTAICMTSLHATGDKTLVKVIQNARTFMAGAQLTGQDVHSGGFGYSRNSWRRSTDMMNTLHAVEAMRLTQDVEDLRGTGKTVDVNWKTAIKYIEQMQNKADAGDGEAGGFFYKPGKSGAGTTKNEEGEVIFRSYGSMTYVGLLALMYSKVGHDDPRVRSAVDWASKHWSLEENPGLGKQGMYFFYHVLTKALTVYGQPTIPMKDNSELNWRAAVAEKLLSLQKKDDESGQKYWINESGRYWENNPILVTSYTLLALEMLLGKTSYATLP